MYLDCKKASKLSHALYHISLSSDHNPKFAPNFFADPDTKKPVLPGLDCYLLCILLTNLHLLQDMNQHLRFWYKQTNY